jgi:hypothetical protein
MIGTGVGDRLERAIAIQLLKRGFAKMLVSAILPVPLKEQDSEVVTSRNDQAGRSRAAGTLA